MPLVNAKCTNCGASLTVDSSKDAAVCSFCGSAYIVEKAIQNYNIVNNNTITASVVNIYGGATDYVMRAGTLEKYEGTSMDAVIPETAVSIGSGAFSGCRGLKSVRIPDTVTRIGAEAFDGCGELTSIVLPKHLISIGEKAFRGCRKLQSIVLPEGLEHIGASAFLGAGIAELEMPDSVQTIGERAFSDCRLLWEVRFPKRMARGGLRLIRTFSGCTELARVELLRGVKALTGTFKDCKALTGIALPDSLTNISGAFEGCAKLRNIDIPSAISHLGGRTFFGCLSLRLVTIDGTALRTMKNDAEVIDVFGTEVPYGRLLRGRCPECGGEYGLLGRCKGCGIARDGSLGIIPKHLLR